MSRFANPNATKRFDLGPCECPGTPHEEGDWLVMRYDLSGDDLIALEEAEPWQKVALLVRDWNLLADDGTVAPLEEEWFRRLYLENFPAINAWLKKNAKTSALPKGSAGRSRSSSPDRASRTPKVVSAA